MDYHQHLKNRFVQLSKPLQTVPTDTEPELNEIYDIHAVIYDFYGTLFISGVGEIGVDEGSFDPKLLREALVHSNIHVLDDQAGNRGIEIYNQVVDEKIQEMKARGIDFPEPDIRTVWIEVLIRMSKELLIEEPELSEQIELLAVEFEARMNPVWPMNDALDTLNFFKKRGIQQGIISNSQFYTPLLLEALLLRPLNELGFHRDLFHWSFEEGQKKPSQNFFSSFIKKLNQLDEPIKAEQVLYVGNDMLKDIYPAIEAGMKTALFAGDKRSLKWRKDHEACLSIYPDIVITELSQLKECINPED